MQYARTYYWQTSKEESTQRAMNEIGAACSTGNTVVHLAVGSLGNNWAFATVIFENHEDSKKEGPFTKTHLEQIAETWGMPKNE